MKINTNTSSLNSLVQANLNQNQLNESLTRLGSGLRINSAKDDASGMAISNTLVNSAHTLKQASNNANDAIAMLQIADRAIDEQMKILTAIKTKATQAAQDGQSQKTRMMLQNDISRLLEEFDAISNHTNYNNIGLLNGNFVNKKFQIGSASNQFIQTSIFSTHSSQLGNTRFETSSNIVVGNYGNINIKINSLIDQKEYTISNITIGSDKNQGLGTLTDEINKISDKTGIRASYDVKTMGTNAIIAGQTGSDFSINGILIGKVDVKAGDTNGALIQAINAVKNESGVEASIDASGKLILNSLDGRGIVIKDSSKGIFELASFRGTQAIITDVKNFQATSDGGIIINGENIKGANSVDEFIKNVNTLSDKTHAMAVLEDGKIKIVSLNPSKSLSISGNEVASKLGIALSTVRGDWVKKDSFITRPPAQDPQWNSLAFLVQYEGESEPRWTPRIILEGKADGKYTLNDIANCFNKASAQTGITAFVEENDQGQQRLCFDMPEGMIMIKGISTGAYPPGTPKPPGYSGAAGELGFGGNQDRPTDSARVSLLYENYGRITLTGSGALDIQISVIKDNMEQNGLLGIGDNLLGFAQSNANLQEIIGGLNFTQKQAMGFFASIFDANSSDGEGLSLKKAMTLMDISDNAISDLGKIRSDIGSTQNQLQATINNISVTEISLLNSASNIKDLDFAKETTEHARLALIMQSNTAMLYKTDSLKTQLFSILFPF